MSEEEMYQGPRECCGCGEDELRTALAAAESKIAALKVDLAAMQKQRDEAEKCASYSARRSSTMENERDAALADLSQARAQELAKHNALIHAYEVMRCPTVRPCGHSGDEDSNQCDEDCAKCAIEGALAHADEALSSESTAAVEAYAELEAVYEAAKDWRYDDTMCLCHLMDGSKCAACVMRERLDKVDARRAGGKDGAK